jgi:hypothetical protein
LAPYFHGDDQARQTSVEESEAAINESFLINSCVEYFYKPPAVRKNSPQIL